MILEYYHGNDLTTKIYIDYKSNFIGIINYTEDNLERAFGVNENPTMNDFKEFMESRCVPKTRANIKDILAHYELNCYDPVEICKITHGKMAEDKQWMKFIDDNYNLTDEEINDFHSEKELFDNNMERD